MKGCGLSTESYLELKVGFSDNQIQLSSFTQRSKEQTNLAQAHTAEINFFDLLPISLITVSCSLCLFPTIIEQKRTKIKLS